jgi:cytosine/adenosine deaminase-related metal-dependent hydrolase
MLLAKLRSGPARTTARTALEMATMGSAGCLGRLGEIGSLRVGAAGDVAVWRLDGPRFAGAIADPVEAWLRCGPVSAWHTVVHGVPVVEDGQLVSDALGANLRLHRAVSERIQQLV